MNGVRADTGYWGLHNHGATCYLNTVLQTLFLTPGFRETLDRKDNDENEVVSRLREVFTSLKTEEGKTLGLMQALGILNVREQQDAAEYFERILNNLTPHLSQMFLGRLRNCTECTEGRHDCTQEYSPFLILPLALQPSSGPQRAVCLVECLKAFFDHTVLDGDNQMYCDVCEKKTDTEMWCEMAQCPQVLTLQLKRFEFDYSKMSYVKDCSPVEVPWTLELKEHTYDLYAVAHHEGGFRGGHYFAHIRSSETQGWYCFNDRLVGRLHPLEVIRPHSAYLLMYMKQPKTPESHAVPRTPETLVEDRTPEIPAESTTPEIVADLEHLTHLLTLERLRYRNNLLHLKLLQLLEHLKHQENLDRLEHLFSKVPVVSAEPRITEVHAEPRTFETLVEPKTPEIHVEPRTPEAFVEDGTAQIPAEAVTPEIAPDEGHLMYLLNLEGQRHQVSQELLKLQQTQEHLRHLESINCLEHMLTKVPVVSAGPGIPVEPRTLETHAELKIPMTLAEPRTPKRPAEPETPETNAEPKTPDIHADPGSPETQAEFKTPDIHAEPGSHQTHAIHENPGTPVVWRREDIVSPREEEELQDEAMSLAPVDFAEERDIPPISLSHSDASQELGGECGADSSSSLSLGLMSTALPMSPAARLIPPADRVPRSGCVAAAAQSGATASRRSACMIPTTPFSGDSIIGHVRHKTFASRYFPYPNPRKHPIRARVKSSSNKT